MRAAVFRGAFDIRVEQIPDASIRESTDAIINVTHACICGTLAAMIFTFFPHRAVSGLVFQFSRAV
jgi:threonine dehydrogenase-like Zn-dependent dehydrogenase